MLAVVVCAYLAAVYLVWDAREVGDVEMEAYFRVRAIVAAVAAGLVAFIGIFVIHHDARYLFDGFTSRALPFVVVSSLCGAGSLLLLVRSDRGARALSIGAVAAVVVGWGVAQWPYMLPTSLKVSQAAAPDPTLQIVLLVTVLAAVLILPAFGLLFVLDQKGELPAEGVGAS